MYETIYQTIWIKELSNFKYDKQSQEIYVYKNLPLIGAITNMSKNVINSEEYYVKDIIENIVVVCEKFGEEEMQFEIHFFFFNGDKS